VDNFQYKVKIQFSEKVNILDEIENIIQIKKKGSARRLLATTYDYVNYTIIDYGNGLYEFILKDFDPQSTDNSQF
jgi:hypothetical protein